MKNPDNQSPGLALRRFRSLLRSRKEKPKDPAPNSHSSIGNQVSPEDQLIYRFANPRTGIIDPVESAMKPMQKCHHGNTTNSETQTRWKRNGQRCFIKQTVTYTTPVKDYRPHAKRSYTWPAEHGTSRKRLNGGITPRQASSTETAYSFLGLYHLLQSALRTINNLPILINTLLTPEKQAKDRLKALKDTILGIIYLFLSVVVLGATGKGLFLGVYWLFHPVRFIFSVLRWLVWS